MHLCNNVQVCQIQMISERLLHVVTCLFEKVDMLRRPMTILNGKLVTPNFEDSAISAIYDSMVYGTSMRKGSLLHNPTVLFPCIVGLYYGHWRGWCSSVRTTRY